MARTRTMIAELHKLHLIGNKRNQTITTEFKVETYECISIEGRINIQ